MSGIDENELKILKVQVKTWELEFLRLNSKKPSKEDIEQAPVKIKEAYRNYWKLKSKIESEKSDSLIWKCKETTKHKKKKSLTNTIDFSKLNKSLEINGKDFSNPVGIDEELISKNNDLHLSMDSLKDQDNLQNVHDVPINGVIEEVNNVDTTIKFDDIKTPVRVIESQYVNKRSSNANILYSSINFADSPKTLHFKQDIDENWLKRCNENILKNSELPPCKSSDEISDSSSSQKESEYNVESKMHHSPLIASEGFTKTIVPFQTNTKNLEEIPNIIPDESVVLSMNNNIDNSQKKNSSGNKIHNAHMNNQSSYQTKSDFELPNSETNDSSEEHKRQGKKRKLSSVTISNTSHKANHLKRKIAAGTLNENYVSLNIKKKKFSRGHRPAELFEEENVDDIPLPTLEEAAKLAQEANKNLLTKNVSKTLDNKLPSESNNKNSVGKEETHELSDINITDVPSEFLTLDEIDTAKIAVKPLFETTNNGKPISTPDAVYDALKEMGYKKFRDGQESAIMRILCGLSTLVVLPTGSGKSLCYQLPAYMYAKHSKSLAIVVSPLVSLMEDQVTGLPSCIHAVCLHSGMTDVQKNNAMKDITNGVAQILLVSPEAIISRYTFFDLILNSDMPPISFVCIDEVHCISQWSHNFRPSYLQLYKVLTKQLRVKCILGLTATATQSTIKDIISNLDLKDVDESVIGCTNIPQNLLLSVSRDKDKDRALIQLLNGDRFHKCSSIIIYCIRRNETERLAALIRTCMQDEIQSEDEQKIKKKTKSNVLPGQLKLIMLDFHHPGEDLYKKSLCQGNDLWEQQRHIYSNSIDRHSLRKLLKKVFVPCKCISIKEPTDISTLLCYLELHSKQWIEILSPTYATCTIRCYGGSKQLHAIALKNPAIATAIALDTENGKQKEMGSNLTFPIIKIASMIGWKSAQLKRDLKQLEWNGMKRKTGVMVEFSDLAFHVLSPGNLSGEENDAILDFLHSKVLTTEKTELQNLKYSFSHYWECCDEINLEYSEGIKASINKYFARSDLLSDELSKIMDKTSEEMSNEQMKN
ncbi:UNVERIFIED_CONTAM: Recql4 [Trichonephila clavipes]